MKQLLFSPFFFCFLISMAQPPQAINYQAVARNSSGQAVVSQTVKVRFTIKSALSGGNTLYSETDTITTNAFGLFTSQIGTGQVVNGNFSTIDWGNGDKFLQVEMDVTGGNNFADMGTTQLVSVPYALHAKTAESVPGLVSGFSHYVGELFGGGMVFHVYRDAAGTEHGLILSLNNLAQFAIWGFANTNLNNCESVFNGAANTTALVNAGVNANYAGGLCDSLTAGGQTDWYLPAIGEMHLLWNNLYTVNKALSTTPGADEIAPETYHTSTEVSTAEVWGFRFDGSEGDIMWLKGNPSYVRAVRAF